MIVLLFVAKSCPTLCNPTDYSSPASSVRGVFRGKNTGVGLPFPSPGDLPNPGIKPASPVLQDDSLLPRHLGSPF